jgi:hypothetical protein
MLVIPAKAGIQLLLLYFGGTCFCTSALQRDLKPWNNFSGWLQLLNGFKVLNPIGAQLSRMFDLGYRAASCLSEASS